MKYCINKFQSKQQIKSFLRGAGISGALLKKLKKLPFGITVNGIHKNVLYILEEGDILKINIQDTDNDINEHLKPVNIPIEIVYEDENITVVNKPHNMPTHESINNRENSLANALAYRYSDKPYVFRAVNRLDKDTSGIVITANNKFYSAKLSDKIKKGAVSKEYIAIVEGRIEGSGIIEASIGRMGESIIKREVREDGEYAATEYESLKFNDACSVLLVKPKTGRTHQIRVHLASIGHPILGDSMYGGESNEISRQALHCIKMDIEGIGKFYAPLPSDIKMIIRRNFENEKFIPQS